MSAPLVQSPAFGSNTSALAVANSSEPVPPVTSTCPFDSNVAVWS